MKVELRIKDKEVILTAPRTARRGWEEAFTAAGASHQDEMILDTGSNAFDRNEWEW